MECIARVFLVGGSSKAVRYDNETTVERLLQVVVHGIGISSVATPHFSLRLLTGLQPETSNESVWLHPCLPVSSLRTVYGRHFLPSTSAGELRFQLRLRFMPQSAYELLLTESKAFFYLHDQVFEDFLGHVAWKVNQEAALELAALKVCRDYAEKHSKSCIDRKIDVDAVDIDHAIQAFIPNTILCSPGVKPSALKKHLLTLVKKFAHLPTTESVLRSLAILIDIVKFDVEVFKASMGVGWKSPVDLLVGPEVGISYRTNERCDVSRLVELRSILEITVKKIEHSSEKTIVQLKLSGNAQPMFVTVATYDIAESLAHLIDGYQMMFNQGDSVFKIKGLSRCESAEMKAASFVRLAPPTSSDPDVRIKREHVTLKELIGGGQFGNVYKGILNDTIASPVTVAIKVCKAENEPADTQLILQEAHLMKNFRHEHIISLIGVCMDSPIWLIMELAPLGELRQYLQSNAASLDLGILILFTVQVSQALKYLHHLSFVHRDVAARNVLVSSPKCVKLTDFGLSRALDYEAVYTASRGKLPIKWLAPESINYREFSMASDVWMFGVCVWEILSMGVKPWQGVPNANVISQIENGTRPPCPGMCPIALYNFIRTDVWAIEPQKRPTIEEVVMVLQSIQDQLKKRIDIDDIKVIRSSKPVPVILTKIEALPSLTLYRAMEEQRRQAEEDEKWLEEQEDLTMYDPDSEPTLENAVSSLSINRRDISVAIEHRPATKPIGAATGENDVRQATLSVKAAVDHLHNAFNRNMKHDNFILAIRDITSKLRKMFSESTVVINDMEDSRRHEVEMTEALIGNDMRQMSKAMQELVEHMQHPTAYNALRRDIVRISMEMATNCENFLTLLENRHKPDTDFRAVLTDC